jgi:hypothetical protein
MRLCKHCDTDKPLTDFVKKSGRCHDCRKEKARIYNAANKEKRGLYYRANRDKILDKCKSYGRRTDIKEARKKYNLAYRDKNRQKLNQRQVEYERNRVKYDTFFKLKIDLRHCIASGLRRHGYTKRSKTYQLLGADFATVQAHLIATAVRNYGHYDPNAEYHIDHVIPNASADNEEELIKLQHYTNLQLLYPIDNLKKGCK